MLASLRTSSNAGVSCSYSHGPCCPPVHKAVNRWQSDSSSVHRIRVALNKASVAARSCLQPAAIHKPRLRLYLQLDQHLQDTKSCRRSRLQAAANAEAAGNGSLPDQTQAGSSYSLEQTKVWVRAPPRLSTFHVLISSCVRSRLLQSNQVLSSHG
jgi:hypothetical protein